MRSMKRRRDTGVAVSWVLRLLLGPRRSARLLRVLSRSKFSLGVAVLAGVFMTLWYGRVYS